MSNKEQIEKLRDNAELAWASYGYFHLINKKFEKDDKYGDKRGVKTTLADMLNIDYKGYEVVDTNNETVGTLKGDFTPTQTKHFFEKYELLIHQPNTESGFSATLFQNKQTKDFTLVIRGTE